MPLRILTCGSILALVFVSLGHAAPAVPQARLVTLDEKGLPLSKALAEIAKQTNIRVEDLRKTDDPALKLTLKNVPFWEAIDRIADDIGARVYVFPRDARIGLVKRTADAPQPISYSGPFRLAIKRMTVSRDLESNTHHATASVEVAWEPHLQPLLLETRPQRLVVKDDKNANLPVEPEGSSIAPVDGRIALLFDVSLPAPTRAVKTLSLVAGSLSAVGPSKMLPFHFASLDQLDKAAAGAAMRKREVEGITCRITRITLGNDRWSIQVTQDTPPGGSKLESFQSWVVNNEMVLVPKKGGRSLPSSSYVLESATERRAVISYNFLDKDGIPRGKPADWDILYTTPAAVVVTPIPFRFKDVPLP